MSKPTDLFSWESTTNPPVNPGDLGAAGYGPNAIPASAHFNYVFRVLSRGYNWLKDHAAGLELNNEFTGTNKFSNAVDMSGQSVNLASSTLAGNKTISGDNVLGSDSASTQIKGATVTLGPSGATLAVTALTHSIPHYTVLDKIYAAITLGSSVPALGRQNGISAVEYISVGGVEKKGLRVTCSAALGSADASITASYQSVGGHYGVPNIINVSSTSSYFDVVIVIPNTMELYSLDYLDGGKIHIMVN